MASRADFVQFVAEQCGGAGEITARKMFGDYGIYCDGKIFGLIRLFSLCCEPSRCARLMMERRITSTSPTWTTATISPCLSVRRARLCLPPSPRNASMMRDFYDKMSAEEARAFRDAVLSIVAQIPPGRVMTYGLIATLAGWPSHARMVGRTLRYTPGAELLPCHRVVNVQGRTAPGWKRQRELLEEEGVTFKPNGHVDMSRHLWEPPIDSLF